MTVLERCSGDAVAARPVIKNTRIYVAKSRFKKKMIREEIQKLVEIE
jgi:hypothetical protein